MTKTIKDLTNAAEDNINFGEGKENILTHEKSEELIKRHDVENSPFTIIESEKGCFAVMGKYRLTEIRDTVEEVKADIEEKSWNRLVQVIALIANDLLENNINLKKLTKE